jgi:hypothetical protein
MKKLDEKRDRRADDYSSVSFLESIFHPKLATPLEKVLYAKR